MMGTLLKLIEVLSIVFFNCTENYDDSVTGLQAYERGELFYQLLDYCGLHLGLSLGEAEQY